MTGALDGSVFDEVADALRGLVPAALGSLQLRARRYGLKAWFGPAGSAPARQHYEAQVVAPRLVAGASVLALEIGFHSEEPKLADNEAVMARLLAGERRWRRTLGGEAHAGPFLGRPDDWRRLSETWPDPDLGDPDLGTELALRLVDYITALEPLLRR